MASTSFRDSLNSMGWSRREADIPVSTSQSPLLSRLQSINPFGSGGYVRLPTHNEGPGAPLPAPSRREEEEGFFACESISTWSLSLTISACDKTRVPAQPLSSHASDHAPFQSISKFYPCTSSLAVDLY